MPEVLVVDDDTSRAELAECLRHLVHSAKRQVPKVGTDEHPTGWDKLHKTIDTRLTEWQARG